MNRILIVYDVDGWAWHALAKGIARHAPPDYEVAIVPERRCSRKARVLAGFDAVLWCSWESCPLEIRGKCRRLWTLVDHHGGLYEFNPEARWTPDVAATATRNRQTATARWPGFSALIAKNRVLVQRVRAIHPRTVYLSAGMDLDHWRAAPLPSGPAMRVAWCGQVDPARPWHTTKGYKQVLEPLMARLAGQPIAWQTNHASLRRGALTADEMVRFYHEADVFLCTSSTEGAPLPVFEAAACGRPIVSTSVGDVPELVDDGLNGFLLGTFTSQAEASRVVGLAADRLLQLAADRPRLAAMSREIRAKVERRFDWRLLAPQWLEALVSIPAEEPRVQESSWLRALIPWGRRAGRAGRAA